MRLVAIINAWSDTVELLPTCILNIAPVVNKVIVLYSEKSNKGNVDDRITELVFGNLPCQWVNVEPQVGNSSHENELRKRNWGLKLAKEQRFTHFLMMDSDEFYIQDEVQKEKTRIEENNLNGLVCPLKVYIKSPTLWCEDHTLVPFIQKLKPDTNFGHYPNYPFNQDGSGNSHIDPTRRVNHFDRVEMSEIFMHHFSYVRKDMELKINNSSANLNRSRANIYSDLENARSGYISKLYHKELKECENIFNIHI
jgi:hypothetical protein